jgi:hypothetical protein
LLVRDTIRLGTIAWGTEQAKAWGKNWQFDHVRLIADAAYIAHHGSMTGASRARWDELSANRLTEERVHEHLDEMNPYFEQVKELSKRGILQPGAQEAVYIYQSSLVHADGLSASDDSLNEAEKKESTNTLSRSKNPTLYYIDEISGELRTIFPSIHYDGSDAYIIRLAVSGRLADITEMEKYMHTVISADPVGFRLNIRNGGSSAKQKLGGIYVLSMLVGLTGLDVFGNIYLDLWSCEAGGEERDGGLSRSYSNTHDILRTERGHHRNLRTACGRGFVATDLEKPRVMQVIGFTMVMHPRFCAV